jgi:hypothetical protein
MNRYYQPQGLMDAEIKNADIQSSLHLLFTAISNEIQKQGVGVAANKIVDALSGKQPGDGIVSTKSSSV